MIALVCGVLLLASGRAAWAQEPPAHPPVMPSDTVALSVGVLRPGDMVKLFVYREKDLSGDYLINSRGDVQIPGLGIIHVAGLGPAAVEDRIRQTMIDRGYTSPEIAVQPLIRVSVLGEVRQPATYPVDPGTNLLTLVTLAGGPTERADLRHARVIRNGRAYTVDLESALSGSATGRIVLYSNDDVFIPRQGGFTRENLAFVLGILGVALSAANVIVTLTR